MQTNFIVILSLFNKGKQASYFFNESQKILTSAAVDLVHVKHSIIHLLETLTKEQDLVIVSSDEELKLHTSSRLNGKAAICPLSPAFIKWELVACYHNYRGDS